MKKFAVADKNTSNVAFWQRRRNGVEKRVVGGLLA